jgi:hypothetical protein
MGITDALAANGLALVDAELVRDFPGELPALADALASELPAWVATAHDALRGHVVMPPSCRAFRAGAFFRLPRHRRSFYFSGDAAESDVVAIKGTEPGAPDIDAWLTDLCAALIEDGLRSTQARVAEHYALCERKVPAAYSLAEAIREATIAAEVQAAHRTAYGTLAAVPFPLAIHRLPRPIADVFVERLRPRLSAHALRAIDDQLRDGLAVYTYYYPNPPLRVSQFSEQHEREAYCDRLAKVTACDPLAVIDGWVDLFVRLLALGYLPASLGSRGSGDCCNPDNAVLDGGFTDLDSLVSIAELRSDTEFAATLHYSVASLCTTVRTLLVRRPPPGQRSFDVVDLWISKRITTCVQRALASEPRPVDPRVHAYFDPALEHAALIDNLRAYFAG